MTEETPASVTEDVEDLRATVHALAAQLQDNTEKLGALIDFGAAGGEGDAHEPPSPDGEDTKEKKGKGSGKPPAPPLILRLSPDEFDAELQQLDQWVRYVLVPTYLNEITSYAPWCSRWWEHPQAVARLHALWIAWQELTTPEAGGWTGPSVWHRDHLDPCLAALRSPGGPLTACMTTPDHRQHEHTHAPPVDPVETTAAL
ncbi:DUF4913 domain-containing protein [Streptomyces albiaxialis]|uniref:DUF4913 domain-containing protein n=1 Tax=Streptomyces albiaxialis TaxID=329523 RepID=A0ABP5IS47_9ACTN